MSKEIKPAEIHTNDDTERSYQDERLIALVAEYQRELEAGTGPDRQKFITRHPELADAAAECIDSVDMLCGTFRTATQESPKASPPVGEPLAEQISKPLGDFQIVRELARGGMGVVYEAIQLSLGRHVALKVLPFAATFDGRQLQRFKNEAQAAALLHHTHIVPVYAVGCERGVHFYAMQLIEGQSMAVVIKQLRSLAGLNAEAPEGTQRGSKGVSAQATIAWRESEKIGFDLPRPNVTESTVDVSRAVTAGASHVSDTYVRRIARLMVQAAHALDHAHEVGVVHRDIKPANLLVDTADKLWITDFGLAQLQTDQQLTRSGDFLGTFRYMSPEQMRGQRAAVDQRTDIYSLGATFYELLTLEPAVTGQSQQELLFQILNEESRPPSLVNRAVPTELDTIVLKSLHKNSADRYQTAGELAADIQRYLNHEPIRAKRPTVVDRLRKWSRRHPAAVVAAMLLLAVITIASLISARLVGIEQQRTADALQNEQLRAQDAEHQFQQAKRAVDALLQVSEEDLINKPEENTRRRILEIVLGFYQDFIDRRPDNAASQIELAGVQEKVRSILHELEVVHQDMNTGLLEMEAVQKELKLTLAQQEKLKTLLAQWSEERRAFFDQDRRPDDKEDHKRRVAEAEKRDQSINALLTLEQRERFQQLGIQWQGPFAFKEPEVVERMRLTVEQRSQIREIERDMFDRNFNGRSGPGRGPGPGGPGPGGGGRRNFDRFNVGHMEAVAKILAILNDSQRKAWRELTGEPFTAFAEGNFPDRIFGPPGR